ncbi:MAG: DUF4142 domain-containing protein, partial [Planctomycetota bacterium]|nr:DUF4142 domain-containing protein [Planctomycetota bacterium]
RARRVEPGAVRPRACNARRPEVAAMRLRARRILIATLALVALPGCPDRDDPVVMTTAAGEVRTDGEVLEATRALAQAVMESVLAVRPKLQDPAVRELATELLEDHRDARERAMVLARRLGLELEPTPLSRQVERDAEERRAWYVERRGVLLDVEWLGGIRERLEQARDVLERHLVPAARAPEVRELTQDLRRLVADQLARVDAVPRAGR